MPQSTALPVAALVAHIALCVWQEYRRRQGTDHTCRLARRRRGLLGQVDRIEDRVNELSSDRTQAAAAVVRLFAVNEGERWEGQDARRLR